MRRIAEERRVELLAGGLLHRRFCCVRRRAPIAADVAVAGERESGRSVVNSLRPRRVDRAEEEKAVLEDRPAELGAAIRRGRAYGAHRAVAGLELVVGGLGPAGLTIREERAFVSVRAAL